MPQLRIAPWFPALAHWRRSGQKRWWYSERQSSSSTSGSGCAMIAVCSPGWRGQQNREPDLRFQCNTRRSAGCSLHPERSRTKVLPPSHLAHQTHGTGTPHPQGGASELSAFLLYTFLGLPTSSSSQSARRTLRPWWRAACWDYEWEEALLMGEAEGYSGQLNPQFLSQLVSVQPVSSCTRAGQAA